MTLPDKRLLNFAGFAVCVGLMGYALYAQYQLMLEPCPLCVFQRIAVIVLGVVFLIAALHNSAGVGSKIYAGLLGLATVFGVVVAGRHIWLQNLPPDEVPSCGPGLGYMLDNFPLGDALEMVFTGSGECANIDWQFLGLSMPTWVLVAILGLGGVGIWNNLRKSA